MSQEKFGCMQLLDLNNVLSNYVWPPELLAESSRMHIGSAAYLQELFSIVDNSESIPLNLEYLKNSWQVVKMTNVCVALDRVKPIPLSSHL